MSKKVYIIEDDESVRYSLMSIIDEMLDDVEVVGFNENGHDGIVECLKLKSDLAICDIRLPDVNGIEILHILKKRNPDIKVLIHSGFLDLNTAKLAYNGEADGILEKPASINEIKTAINTVLSGDDFYSPNVLDKLLTHETRAPFKRKET
jgi:DNA-binding NarL/FixJ family response regulator